MAYLYKKNLYFISKEDQKKSLQPLQTKNINRLSLCPPLVSELEQLLILCPGPELFLFIYYKRTLKADDVWLPNCPEITRILPNTHETRIVIFF